MLVSMSSQNSKQRFTSSTPTSTCLYIACRTLIRTVFRGEGGKSGKKKETSSELTAGKGFGIFGFGIQYVCFDG